MANLKTKLKEWLSGKSRKQKGFLWTFIVFVILFLSSWLGRDVLDAVFAEEKGDTVAFITSTPFILAVSGIFLFLLGAVFATFLEEIFASIKRVFGVETEISMEKKLMAFEHLYNEGAGYLSDAPSRGVSSGWEEKVHEWDAKTETFLNKFCPLKQARRYRLSPKLPAHQYYLGYSSKEETTLEKSLENRLRILREIIEELS